MQHVITHDLEFAQWANDSSSSGHDLRRDLTIDVFDEAGRKVISYKVYRAWVRELTARPKPDIKADTLLIESITIEHEGCEVESGE